MKRRTTEQLDPLDLLRAAYHLSHWPDDNYRGQSCREAHFATLDLLAALRSQQRLDDDERAVLTAAVEVGV